MVIAFAGRRVDPPAADPAPFPPENEGMVGDRIRRRFRELGIDSVMVLPWARDRFREKLTGPNVKYLHTKYVLVDPLGDDPIVVSGSANFSKPSYTTDTGWEPFFGDTRNARRRTFLA